MIVSVKVPFWQRMLLKRIANKIDHLQFSTRIDRNLIFDHNEYLHVSTNLTTIENKAIAELHNELFGTNTSIPTSPQTEFNSFC